MFLVAKQEYNNILSLEHVVGVIISIYFLTFNSTKYSGAFWDDIISVCMFTYLLRIRISHSQKRRTTGTAKIFPKKIETNRQGSTRYSTIDEISNARVEIT